MEPEPGEEIFFQGHPSRRAMKAFYLKGLIVVLVVGVIVGLITRLAGHSVSTVGVIVGVLAAAVATVVYGEVWRAQTRYAITNRRLTIETGLLSREVHQTRIERIQNVNTKQGVIDRMLNIGIVEFETAGEAGYNFSFRGVDDPRRIVVTVDRALQELRSHGPDAPAIGV